MSGSQPTDAPVGVPAVTVGVWTNWSRGKVMGKTLTLERRDADLLIAFTAIFVAFVGTRFWRTICLFLHRCYSTPRPQNALHHQRQVTLRNSSSAESAAYTLVYMGVAWRKSARASSSVIAVPLLAAITCSLCFALAGGFSSMISTAVGNEVLIDGSNCGFPPWNGELTTMDGVYQAAMSSRARQVANAKNYAEQCYSSTPSSSQTCNSFIQPRLPTSIDKKAPCPFESNVCRSETENLRLDTGYIDSNTHLGMNAQKKDKILFRYILHCAPLKTEGYTSSHNTSTGNFIRYHYGITQTGSSGKVTQRNYTYQVPDLDFQSQRALGGNNYLLSSLFTPTRNGSSIDYGSWIPAPELQHKAGDLNIVFLSGNGVAYTTPVDDPWYRATRQVGQLHNVATNGSRPTYMADEAASPMGCIESFQFCNGALPGTSGCGPVASWRDALDASHALFNLTFDELYSNEPTDAAKRIRWIEFIWTNFPGNLSWVFYNLKALSLDSLKLLGDGTVESLPSNQWQLDVTHWWATTLSALQAALVEASYGPADPKLVPLKIRYPPGAVGDSICNNQMIRSTQHGTFSLFGLLFIYITGSVLIAISWLLVPLLQCLQRRRQFKQYKYLEWMSNSILQVQRTAYEETSHVEWTNCTDDVPITNAENSLPCLDIEDINHPRLVKY